jgi:hypothetical protein
VAQRDLAPYTERTCKVSILRSVEERLQALEERVQLLDILQLEAEYARAWDFGSGEEWANVFTADGVFELAGSEGVDPMPASASQRFEGRAALAAFRDAFSSAWSMQHQMHLPSITVAGDRATSVVYFDCPVSAQAVSRRSMLQRETGVYSVAYLRGADGWRMSRRVEHPTFRVASHFLGQPKLP